MWRASHQDGLSFDPNLLQPQHQAVLRTSAHDATFRHQQQASQEVSEQHNSECMQAHLSSQLNGNFAHGLPPALLPEAAHGQAADLPNVQLDLDTATLSAALGLGDNFLAHLHRNIGENTGQSSSELSAILAASLGVLPVSVHSTVLAFAAACFPLHSCMSIECLQGTSSINTLLGQDGSASSFVGSPPLPSLLPQSSLANAKVCICLPGCHGGQCCQDVQALRSGCDTLHKYDCCRTISLYQRLFLPAITQSQLLRLMSMLR